MGNAKVNLTPFFNLKCLNLNHNLKGYIGLYHRFKALPEDKVCCEQTHKDDKILNESTVQSGATIHALKKLFLKM